MVGLALDCIDVAVIWVFGSFMGVGAGVTESESESEKDREGEGEGEQWRQDERANNREMQV